MLFACPNMVVDNKASAVDEALRHVFVCQEMLDGEPLEAVQAYCRSQHILPPVVIAKDHADSSVLQEEAANKLRDYGWWIKRIKLRDARMAHQRGKPRRTASAHSTASGQWPSNSKLRSP